MEQTTRTPETYDYRKYDHIWQRVAPALEPYPADRQEDMMSSGEAMTSVQSRQESQLPGASKNPCCMGSAAVEMLEVLVGFAEEELSDRRYMMAMLKQAPVWARQCLRDIAGKKGEHAGRLMAAYYLITGECYRPSISCERIYIGRWCPALRERYHAEACSGFNYARAADGTTDLCLQKLLNTFSQDAYRHAELLLKLLERSLQG